MQIRPAEAQIVDERLAAAQGAGKDQARPAVPIQYRNAECRRGVEFPVGVKRAFSRAQTVLRGRNVEPEDPLAHGRFSIGFQPERRSEVRAGLHHVEPLAVRKGADADRRGKVFSRSLAGTIRPEKPKFSGRGFRRVKVSVRQDRQAGNVQTVREFLPRGPIFQAENPETSTQKNRPVRPRSAS